MRYIFIALTLMLHTVDAYKLPYKAVIHVPIADLVGQPIQEFSLRSSARESYAHLPLSSAERHSTCPRIHQALFNEMVTVIEEAGDEVCITMPHVFYTTPRDSAEKNIFWTLKRNIVPVELIEQEHHLNLDCFPAPIEHTKRNMVSAHHDVISLWLPFTSPVTGKQFSAGTRFAQAAHKRGRDRVYKVYEYDSDTQQFHVIKIPKHYCFQTGAPYTRTERQDAFVSLVKTWAHVSGVIPFVWGGCSFKQTCASDNYHVEHTRAVDGHTQSFWVRSEMRGMLQAGFDSSGLVLRAAQICGIPYFYKNSTTAARYLTEKRTVQSLQEGDLIWVPYGLYIISDIKEHKAIAACGYDPGYGRVVQLQLHEIFEHIETYAQLMHAVNRQEPIALLKADGSVSRTVAECKVLALQSVWD